MSTRATAALALAAALGASAFAFAPPAAGQSTPTLRVVGFASTTNGPNSAAPRVEARTGGTIRKCVSKRSLAAVFLAGGLAKGTRYQQYWSSRGAIVFRGQVSVLNASVGAPRRVFMGFSSRTNLKNGTYVFQLVVNGRPHVLGQVVRKC